MHIVKLDLKYGLISIDSIPIAVEENGVLASSIAKLCSLPIATDEGKTRYRLANKACVFGKSADCVIEAGEGRVCSVTFLFDQIEFFESSVLESKVVTACEKCLNQSFVGNHPSTVVLDCPGWGQAIVFYDAKQGDLTWDISFRRKPNESSL